VGPNRADIGTGPRRGQGRNPSGGAAESFSPMRTAQPIV